MPDLNRVVAGLRCADVLALLSDYLDGELPGPDRSRVEAHLTGCDHCARFGGRVSAVVTALRDALSAPESLTADVEARLRQRLLAEPRAPE